MKRQLFILPLLLSMVACSSVATKPEASAPPVSLSSDAQKALDYLEQNRSKYALKSPRQQLRLQQEGDTSGGFKQLRFQQYQSGLPVWGDDISVYLDPKGRVHRVDGMVRSKAVDRFSQPRLSEPEIERRAGDVMPGGLSAWRIKRTQLYIYPDWKGARLAYLVELRRGLMRHFVLLDANSGQLIKRVEWSSPNSL